MFMSGLVEGVSCCQPWCVAECRTVTKQGASRVKLSLSDGTFMITGLVATDCREGSLSDLSSNSVIQVTEFILQDVSKPCAPANPIVVLGFPSCQSYPLRVCGV